MEKAKHKEPIFVVPTQPVAEPEEIEDQPEEPRRTRRKPKKEKESGRGFFDITNIITKFFSEENEIKE